MVVAESEAPANAVAAGTPRQSAGVPPAAWVAVLVAVIGIVMMPRLFMIGDPLAWREEARSLMRSGGLSIDAARGAALGEPGQYFVLNDRNGRYYSKFGVGNALLSLPAVLAEAAVAGKVPAVGDEGNVLVWNLYNIVLSVLTARVLLSLAGRYTGRPGVRVAYVLACMFGGFLWYFQRAQSQEIYQVLLFSTFFLVMTRFLDALSRSPDGQLNRRAILDLTAAWAVLALLILTRISFGVLLMAPYLASLSVLYRRRPLPAPATIARLAAMFVVPSAVILALIGWINWAKFGSPFLTGYHAWRPDLTTLNGSVIDGLSGFLFSTRWSIFVYFPLLALSLAGWGRFLRHRRADATLALVAFVPAMLVVAAIPAWRGEWTYGPRYLLFALPVLSLPVVMTADHLLSSETLSRRTIKAIAAVALVPLLYAAWLNFQVNRLEFFAVHRIASPLEAPMNQDLFRYLNDHVEGTILRDLQRHQDDLDRSALFQLVKKSFSPAEMDGYRDLVRQTLDNSNFYWISRGTAS